MRLGESVAKFCSNAIGENLLRGDDKWSKAVRVEFDHISDHPGITDAGDCSDYLSINIAAAG